MRLGDVCVIITVLLNSQRGFKFERTPAWNPYGCAEVMTDDAGKL